MQSSRGMMTDRHAKALARLEQRLRTGPGELSPQTRAAAIDGGSLPDPLAQGYVETVRRHAYKLTDRRLEELAEAGWTDRQVFELTVAAAFGAAKRRLDAGLQALGEAGGTRRPAGEG
jgi:alkylhydroperoxidase family enzyme